VTLGFIWLAASAGALSLLTPCVFPMVPITVSYFTSHAATSRRTSIRHALVFGLGIIASFTALGLALAVFVGAAGVTMLAGNPWVNLLLTAIFVGFALNLFGVFQVTIPSTWLTALDNAVRRQGAAGQGAGVLGALLMGLTFTLTSFTCTAPFVGTVLVTAAQGKWQEPLLGMLVYSTVFALPFCVLALVPEWVSRLPRAGGWLQSTKVVMGFVELAAAMKFLSNTDLVWRWGVVTRTVVLASWVVLAAITVVYLLRQMARQGKAERGEETTTGDAAGRRMSPAMRTGYLTAAAGALAIGVWLATGLTGRSLGDIESFLPPTDYETAAATAINHGVSAPMTLAWRLNDYPAALALAKQQGKRVFIDFTGYTCTNCRWMEANIFTRPDVKAALGQFVLSRLFTDGDGDMYERQQAFQESQFKTVALPLYAIVDADGHTVTTLPGLTRDPVAFVAFLEKGLESPDVH
jgi:thiol:disulfide interchange protein